MTVLVYRDGELTPLQETETETRFWVGQAVQQMADKIREDWPRLHRPSVLVDHVLNEFQLVWTGSFLIAYDVVECWFSPDVILSEEFIASFGNHTPSENVDAALLAVAKKYGCNKIARGTRSESGRQNALARLLSRRGYKPGTIELIKEISL